MRGDMPKVIVERARRGGGKLRRVKTVRDDDAALSKVGVRRDALLRGADKGLNENLNPLRRYLEAQVDRPWRKIWSEICENLKPSNTVQQHVRDHIPGFVAIKTSLRDGAVWVHERGSPVKLYDSFVYLYVDPKTGILRRNKHWVSWQAKRRAEQEAKEKVRDARMRVLSATKQLHLFGDTWWEVTLAPVPTGWATRKIGRSEARSQVEYPVNDVVLRSRLSALPREDLYGRRGVYAVVKRQLSRKEMRDKDLRPAR